MTATHTMAKVHTLICSQLVPLVSCKKSAGWRCDVMLCGYCDSTSATLGVELCKNEQRIYDAPTPHHTNITPAHRAERAVNVDTAARVFLSFPRNSTRPALIKYGGIQALCERTVQATCCMYGVCGHCVTIVSSAHPYSGQPVCRHPYITAHDCYIHPASPAVQASGRAHDRPGTSTHPPHVHHTYTTRTSTSIDRSPPCNRSPHPTPHTLTSHQSIPRQRRCARPSIRHLLALIRLTSLASPRRHAASPVQVLPRCRRRTSHTRRTLPPSCSVLRHRCRHLPSSRCRAASLRTRRWRVPS